VLEIADWCEVLFQLIPHSIFNYNKKSGIAWRYPIFFLSLSQIIQQTNTYAEEIAFIHCVAADMFVGCNGAGNHVEYEW
jgi:hypothetical protein